MRAVIIPTIVAPTSKHADSVLRSWMVIAFAFALVFIGHAQGQTTGAPMPIDDSVHVEADKLEVDTEKTTADFIGSVTVRQQNTTIQADRLRIHYVKTLLNDQSKQSDEQSIEKIIATGNVRINFDNRVAVADQAVYTAADRILILTGHDAKVSDPQNSISGEKITIFRADGRMVAERGKQKQVDVIVTTGKNGIN